jgi:hypothetical protein
MDATAWLIISIIGYSLAGVLLIITIVLFFKMNIRGIIWDLTGKTAARQILEIREQHKMNGTKRSQPNVLKGIFSRQLASRSGWLGKTEETSRPLPVHKLPAEMMAETEILTDPEATEILSEDSEVLVNGMAATELLLDESEVLIDKQGTTLLSDTSDEANIPAVGFKKVKDIKVTHSSEVIK